LKPVSIEALHVGVHGAKAVNTYIFLAIGGLAGWLYIRLMPAPTLAEKIENILIGMMGAFLGGDFLSVQISGDEISKGFHISALALAVLGAAVMLLLLKLMRQAVGPMKKGKSSQKKRDY
jgi:uncharacterized membrane protein YeaQ/YmgE (transglycosylase-associated protein family)